MLAVRLVLSFRNAFDMITGWAASQTYSNTSRVHVLGKPALKHEQLRLHVSEKPSNVQQVEWLKTTQLGQAIELTARRTYVHTTIDLHATPSNNSKWQLCVSVDYDATSSPLFILPKDTDTKANKKERRKKYAVFQRSFVCV